jgi:potassium channel subfamily K
VWSQSYYFCLYAAVIYFILASFLLVNFLGGYFRHYKQDIALSTALRTLLLNTVLFLAVLFLGALVFSYIEGWPYLDALYWADVTLLTIGFGDISPDTTLGRALLFPYTIGGIVCLGITLASIRRLVLDRGQLGLRKGTLRKMCDALLKEPGNDGEHHSFDTVPLFILKRADGNVQVNIETFSMRDHHRLYVVFVKARDIQSRARRKWRWTAFAISSAAWFVLLFGGAAIFMVCERTSQDWSYFEALYMAFISLTTIGYGNLTPTSSSGRSFFVLWSLLSVPAIAILISNTEETLLRLVHGITMFIGGITILPGQGGFGKQVERCLRALGFRRGRQPLGDSHLEVEIEQNQARKLPTTRPQYCAILLDEILGIIRHLSEQPLQNYSFEKWVWFGKLLGELEHIPVTEHKQSRDQQENGPQEHVAAEGINPPVQFPPSAGLDTFMFGEFTTKSPLMGPKEEAEWFLERLIAALKQELGTMAR